MNDSDSTQEPQRAARKRRAFAWAGLIPIACSFPPFLNSMGIPGVAALRGVDIFRLLVAGACFGAGVTVLLSGLIWDRVGPRDPS